MKERGTWCKFNQLEVHKGFYIYDNPKKMLSSIKYSEFRELPNDVDFPYDDAELLLCGSCNYFVMSLKEIFGYNPYIIEGKNNVGFHAFCQIYKYGKWFYIDARGITSSFDEFMNVAKEFVHDEYIIRSVNSEDIKEWELDDDYKEDVYFFSKSVIEKYKECYIFDL